MDPHKRPKAHMVTFGTIDNDALPLPRPVWRWRVGATPRDSMLRGLRFLIRKGIRPRFAWAQMAPPRHDSGVPVCVTRFTLEYGD